MIRKLVSLIAIFCLCLATNEAAQLSLTVYNQNFAVVRQELPLELKAGLNSIQVTDITMHLDHTPRNETVRVYTGNAFDLAGERRRTDFKIDSDRHFLDESFEIKVRNHKEEPVNVRVVEHLYRWINWELSAKSDSFRKIDSQTIEFPITIAPNAEKAITYTVHYTW